MLQVGLRMEPPRRERRVFATPIGEWYRDIQPGEGW